MNTKNRVLELLEKHRGKYLSGEEISGLLRIPCSTVWKAIKSLKNEGYSIQAVTNRGYSLICQMKDLPKILSQYSKTTHRFFASVCDMG